ncbi:PepSY domain-containing protein [Agaribacterium sp. ZY112]|uniref:PepSY domain-containing protein n=1 Tax=Agaribacterium sp. ZY112 TaxID=3233574 RepID=UPI0035231BBE
MKKLTTLLALSLTSSFAFAGADCPEAEPDTWLSKLDMQKKIVNDYGFSIKRFLIDGNCYEIYGWETDSESKEEKRIEVYFNPVNGDIVKKKSK